MNYKKLIDSKNQSDKTYLNYLILIDKIKEIEDQTFIITELNQIKKVVGQLWHAGQNSSKEIIEESISNNKIEVRIFRYILKRNSKKNKIYYWHRNKTTRRTLKRYTFKYYSNSNNILLEKFYTDVTYDNFIKVLSLELGTYNVIIYDTFTDFLVW